MSVSESSMADTLEPIVLPTVQVQSTLHTDNTAKLTEQKIDEELDHSLQTSTAIGTVALNHTDQMSLVEKTRAQLRNNLDCHDIEIDQIFQAPDTSIEFAEKFGIPLLGNAKSGRNCLLRQWFDRSWREGSASSFDTTNYRTIRLFNQRRQLVVYRSRYRMNDRDQIFIERSLNDKVFTCFIICVDMTKQDCNEEANNLLTLMIDKRKDYRRISVIVAGTKCDQFMVGQSSLNTETSYDRVMRDLIKQNIQKLENLVKHFQCKHDLSVLFIPTSAKYNWNVSVVFEACVAQWMSVHEFEYLEARRMQEEANQDAALDCCMNPLVLALYDAVTIIVSLADISTDLWVLIHWYSLGRMTPFYISLTILICAQLSYIAAFLFRFCANGNFSGTIPPNHRDQRSIWLVLLVIIPISPFLSFVMFFASLKDSWLADWMDDRGFDIDDPSPRKHASKIESFLTEKLHKHMGFLLEAGVEAFPQSILQMAVMVSYSETNWVSVVSILLSLISVCTKSLVFSYALELRTMLFNYLSLCLDFISIFALISWIFYNPNGNGITTLGQIFLYRIALTTVPFVTIAGFVVATVLGFDDFSYQRIYGRHAYCNLMANLCIFYTLWIIATPFAILGTEVACSAGLAFIMFFFFSDRFNSSAAAPVFWGQVFSFVNAGHSWDDKKLRCVMVIEAIMSADSLNDEPLAEYIKNSRQQTYSNVTWSGLRKNTRDPEEASLIGIFLKEQRRMWKNRCNDTNYLCDCEVLTRELTSGLDSFKDVIVDCLSWPIGIFCIYFAIPIYVCSRVFNFTFVWIALFNINDFNDIDHLQLGMAVLLGILQMTWLISLVMALRFHFVTWHIGAGHDSVSIRCPNEEKAFVLLKRITDLHNAHTTEPERRKVILEHFGPDIASVVLDYMPTLIYDIGETVT